jgi:hypothetical protein
MTGTTDSFKGKLKLWKTQLMKGVLCADPLPQRSKSRLVRLSTFCVT